MAIRKRKRPQRQPQVVLSGSHIRLEPIVNTRKPKPSKPRVVVSAAQDISPVGGFFGFLRQHAVVGLIIGFVLGTQVQSLVKQLVQSFLDPLTQLLFGTALSARTFTLHWRDRSAQFGWGAMAYALIIFLFVLITMYVVIKLLNLDSLEKEAKKKEED